MKASPALVVLIGLFNALSAFASPLNVTSTPNLFQRDAVDCDEIKDYTTEFFVEHPEIWKPKPSTCLFYTYGLSADAQLLAIAKRFAHEGGYAFTTIWDIRPQKYYNGNVNDDQNSLRCIMQSANDRRTYFENMSRAMAQTCAVTAYVMSDSSDPATIPTSGIWGRIEFEELKLARDRNQVNYVFSIGKNSNDPTTAIYWTRPDNRPVEFDDQPSRFHDNYDLGQLVEWFSDLSW